MPQPSLILQFLVRKPKIIDGDLQQDNTNHDRGEHGFRSNAKTLLDPPEAVDTNGLGTNSQEKEIGQGKSVIRDDGVLKCSNHGDGGVERVTQEKVAYRSCKSCSTLKRSMILTTYEIQQTLLQSPDLRDGSVQLPETHRNSTPRFSEPHIQILGSLHIHMGRHSLAWPTLLQGKPR